MAKRVEVEEVKNEVVVSYGTATQFRSLSIRSGVAITDLMDILCILLRAGLDRGLERPLWVQQAATLQKGPAGVAKADDVTLAVSVEAKATLAALAALGGLSEGAIVETALARGGYASLVGLARVEPWHWAGFAKRI